jgi:hypothetical protein
MGCDPCGQDGPLNGKAFPLLPLLLLLHANSTPAVQTAAHAIAVTILIAEPSSFVGRKSRAPILHVFALGL